MYEKIPEASQKKFPANATGQCFFIFGCETQIWAWKPFSNCILIFHFVKFAFHALLFFFSFFQAHFFVSCQFILIFPGVLRRRKYGLTGTYMIIFTCWNLVFTGMFLIIYTGEMLFFSCSTQSLSLLKKSEIYHLNPLFSPCRNNFWS